MRSTPEKKRNKAFKTLWSSAFKLSHSHTYVSVGICWFIFGLFLSALFFNKAALPLGLCLRVSSVELWWRHSVRGRSIVIKCRSQDHINWDQVMYETTKTRPVQNTWILNSTPHQVSIMGSYFLLCVLVEVTCFVGGLSGFGSGGAAAGDSFVFWLFSGVLLRTEKQYVILSYYVTVFVPAIVTCRPSSSCRWWRRRNWTRSLDTGTDMRTRTFYWKTLRAALILSFSFPAEKMK